MNKKNIRFIIQEIAQALEPYYESETHAQTVAWWLLEALTKQSKSNLIVTIFVTLTDDQTALLHNWIYQLTVQNYPLQYLLGSVPFGPLTIQVKAPTLIPRPETESWCASLIASLAPVAHLPLRILDMCTGSGCIGLWLAHALPHATVYAVDISDEALSLAQANAASNGITNIHFLKSDLFTLLNPDTPFDLIVSNPPYISPDAWHNLPPTVAQWEDRGALIAGNQGLALIQQIAASAPQYLQQHSPLTHYGIARLVIEIGYDQGKSTSDLFIRSGFSRIQVLVDYAERDRVVCGWY